jgi:hypothetical protein
MKIAILETNMMRETKPDTVRIIFNAGDCPVFYGDGNCDTGQHVIVEGEKSDLLTWFSKHRYVWVGSSNMMAQAFTAAKVNAEGTALEGYDFSDREAIEEANAYVRWCDEQSRAFVEARNVLRRLDEMELNAHRTIRSKRSPTVKLKHVKRIKR